MLRPGLFDVLRRGPFDSRTPGGPVSFEATDELDALHAAWRALLDPAGEPRPEQASVEAGGATLARGSRVVVRPQRCADSIDFLIAGRTARVEGVYRDLEGRVLVAVVFDDDPAGALHGRFGRFFYYGPEELEPAMNEGGPP